MANRGFKDPKRASEAGKKGAAVLMEKLGRDHFVEMGKAGGAANRDRHDADYFKELGRRGGRTRWERQRARQAEDASTPDARS